MLDNNQLEAVNFFMGPCLTLAGPGSGKTTVLVNRIKHLIEKHNVAPSKILVITFTKDAALEMKSRFINSCNNSAASLVNFGTFHSVFFNILRQESHLNSDSILQGKSLLGFLREVIKANSIKADDSILENVYSEFSYINNTGTCIEDYNSKGFDNEQFRLMYKSYQAMKRELNKIDFDDMLGMTYKLFTDNPEVLLRWQNRFEFFLIDEMQDMNDIQFNIVKMLASSKNIFAVGDDDQSIYGFRGANPDIMQQFPKYYSDCTVIRLRKNYRSAKMIVEASSKLISYNKTRFGKSLSAFSASRGVVEVKGFRDNEAEANYVCLSVEKALRSDDNSSIAILFRNKNQSLLLMKHLTSKGIPYYVKERVGNIYNHWVFKDIISFIKLSLQEGTRADMLRIYNKPNRYISRACIDSTEVSFYKMRAFYSSKPYMQQRISDMEHSIMRIKTMRPASAINYIRKRIGYDDYIKEISRGNKRQYDDLMKMLDNIVSMGKEFTDIRSFLNECNLRTEFDNERIDESHARVSLYTFHASKGLEFDKVYILDVNEGITPSKKVKNVEELEEERRMFYVALTRAKSSVMLCNIESRNNEKLFPSRFIDEMSVQVAHQTSC